MSENPMEVLYQRRCAKYVYVVPEGLRELMTDISREVLREHPKQIYTFIADYLDSLLITRENAKVAARFVENITEMGVITIDLLNRTRMSRAQADKAARIIQRSFRRHMKLRSTMYEPLDDEEILDKMIQRLHISLEQAERATKVIQRAYRCHKMKMAKLETMEGVDWRLAARKTIGVLRHLQTPQHELERAATLIKAAYKGYYTRKLMRRLVDGMEKCQDTSKSTESTITPEVEDSVDEEVDYEEGSEYEMRDSAPNSFRARKNVKLWDEREVTVEEKAVLDQSMGMKTDYVERLMKSANIEEYASHVRLNVITDNSEYTDENEDDRSDSTYSLHPLSSASFEDKEENVGENVD